MFFEASVNYVYIFYPIEEFKDKIMRFCPENLNVVYIFLK